MTAPDRPTAPETGVEALARALRDIADRWPGEVAAFATKALLAVPSEPDSGLLGRALSELPPGPYTVSWPAEQGGAFTLWGRQGTPPDFADGWAIPLVASGVDTAINALAVILNVLAAEPALQEPSDAR